MSGAFFRVRRSYEDPDSSIYWLILHGTIHLPTLILTSFPREAAQAAACFFQQLLLLHSEESLGGLSAGHKSSGALITLGRWRNALREKSLLDY